MSPENPRPQEIDSRFRLEGERVAGGMGTVYRGVDLTTQETVAVKISSNFGPKLDARFLQEANCLATITHPAIVRHIAHGRTADGEHYLVMEWLDGETLEDRLSRRPIHLVECVRMIRRVAEALAVAHHHGVIHRDIKPANLFLPGKDLSKTKLLDFGIARRLFDAAALRLTHAGSALGTPMYMSPEQAQGSLDVDARTDAFSLGCVFFECATGAPPFLSDSITGTFARLKSEDGVDVDARCAGLPARLRNLLRRMLAKRPDERPGMADIVTELDTITDVRRGVSRFPPPLKESSPPQNTSPRVATGERRLAAVIVVAPRPAPAHLAPRTAADLGNLLARNLSDAEFDESRLDRLARDLAAFGATIRPRGNGSFVVTLAGEANAVPADLAVRAARCALKVKRARSGSALGISLGYAVHDGDGDTQELIERAARLVSAEPRGAIHLDDDVKGLLETGFEIAVGQDGRSRLLFEKRLREAARTVFGHEIPCLGREREILELGSLFGACVKESAAALVLVTGGAGSGKSRLACEFLERLRESGKDFELLIGRADALGAELPLGLLGQILREAAGIGGSESIEVQRQRLAARLARFLPANNAAATMAFLGEPANLSFADDELAQLRAARRDGALMTEQIRAAWVTWLAAEAGRRPLVLLLENLHGADSGSLHCIDSALRVIGRKPLLVLGLARPEIDDRFGGLWRAPYVHRMVLAPLGKRAGQEFVRRTLGEVSPEKVAWLLDQAEGNPSRLEELVRAAAAEDAAPARGPDLP